MADLSITAANVKIHGDGTSTQLTRVQVGEAVTQGEPLYLNSGDGLYYLARANAASTDAVSYIAVTPAATSGYLYAAADGAVLDVGATLTKGTTYVLSAAAAGGIAPYSDLSAGNYFTVLGVATDTDRLHVKIVVTGDTI